MDRSMRDLAGVPAFGSKVGLVALLACLALAPHSSAAVTVGQAPTPGTLTDCATPGLALQTAVSSGNSYTAPSAGVVTRWRSSFNGTGSFVIARSVPAGFRLVAEDSRTIGGTLTEFQVQIPIAAGDVIGFKTTTGVTQCGTIGLLADVIAFEAPPPAVGEEFSTTPVPEARINMAADVEPDADGDGFGDETQDGCLGNPASHTDCIVPDTTLDNGPKRKTTKRKVKFAFSSNEPAATFECRLDRKPFKACTSPKKLRVKPGKHKFKVRARDAAGNIDLSPAKVRFRVVE